MSHARRSGRALVKRGALLAIGLSVSAGCVRLGFWQWSRHQERRGRNAAIEQRLALPPLTLPDSLTDASLEYRRVVAAGVYDPVRQVIEVGRAVNGVPAVYLVLSLRLNDGSAILVEAGWIPSPDARSVRIPDVSADDTVEVHGVVLAPRNGGLPDHTTWPLTVRFADPVALDPVYPYPLQAWIIRRTDGLPGVTPAPQVIAPPELTGGPHLSYAVQWFVFAVIAAVGAIALLIADAREDRGKRREQGATY